MSSVGPSDSRTGESSSAENLPLHKNLYDDLEFNELEPRGHFTPEAAKNFFPVHEEPPIETMDQPVVIETACPGWQAGGDHYPAVPDSVEAQSQELVDSVEAGAAIVHVHPRDDEGIPYWDDYELLAEILDPVFEECGEVITFTQSWNVTPHADYVTGTRKLLELGEGNKYCQGSVVLPIGLFGAGAFHSPSTVVEGVRYLQEVGVKPIFQVYDTHVLYELRHRLFESEEVEDDSPLLNLYVGAHHSQTTFNDPWSYFGVLSSMYNVRDTIEASHVGITPGGRNWMPMMVLGLLAGANVVRVGIEDAYWMYPHRDDLIPKNSEVVELAVEFAEMLGREVITDPDEAREFLGMEYTSPR